MTTLTIQGAAQDAYIRDDVPTTNFGSSNPAFAGWNGGGGNTLRSLFQFSLASIPVGASITSAILRLKVTTGGMSGVVSYSYVAQRCTSSWGAGTVTWNTQPSYGGTDGSVTIPYTTSNSTVDFPITALVQGWFAGSITNNGLVIRGPESPNDSTAAFYATAAGTAGDRPSLIVTYNTAPTAPSLVSPADNAPVALNTTNFQWTFNDPDSGDTQSAYALRRRAYGTVIYEWWTGSAWTTSSTYVTTSTANVTPTGFTNTDDTYFWSVSTKDAAGVASPYSSERTVNPWEWWNGTNWVYSTEAYITSATPSTTIAAAQFASGDYKWSVSAKDALLAISPYSADTRFTYGGSGAIERFGNFI